MICLGITDSTPGLTQTLQALVFDPEHGPASLGDIANRLALSERTLRRRLRALGTSYNEILQAVRSSTAQEWLRDRQSHDGVDRVASGIYRDRQFSARLQALDGAIATGISTSTA